jgi:hypothetical protein
MANGYAFHLRGSDRDRLRARPDREARLENNLRTGRRWCLRQVQTLVRRPGLPRSIPAGLLAMLKIPGIIV